MIRSGPNRAAHDTDSHLPRERQRMCLPVAFVSAILLFCILGMLLFFARAAFKHVHHAVCPSAPCMRISHDFGAVIDSSVEPCSNFYAHVCNGWKREVTASVYQKHMSQFLGDVAQSLGISAASMDRQNALDKVALFYQSCESIRKDGKDELKRYLEIFDEMQIDWPHPTVDPDILTTTMKLDRVLGITVMADLTQTSRWHSSSLSLLPSGTLIEGYYNKYLLERVGFYEEYFSLLRAEFTRPYNKQAPVEFAYFYSLENNIWKRLVRSFDDDQRQKSIEISVRDITRYVPKIALNRWQAFLNAYFEERPEGNCTFSSTSMYLTVLNDLLEGSGEHALQLYLGWIVVQAVSPVASAKTAEIHARILNDAEEAMTVKCLLLTENSFGWAVFPRFVAQHFKNDALSDVRRLAKEIYASFRSAVSNISWLSPTFTEDINTMFTVTEKTPFMQYDAFATLNDLNRLFERLPNMGSSFATNWVTARSHTRRMNRTLWRKVMSSQVIHASLNFYNFGSDRFHLPPYVGTLPLYEVGVPNGVKYGALGSLIAIEFLQQLVASVPHLIANLPKNWTCYPSNGSGEFFSNRRSMIAPPLFLEFLWHAFEASRNGDIDVWPTPLLQYTSPQVFFIALCYLRCSRTDVLAEIACNEPLRRSKNFAEAFHCTNGSYMNPAEKCSVF